MLSLACNKIRADGDPVLVTFKTIMPGAINACPSGEKSISGLKLPPAKEFFLTYTDAFRRCGTISSTVQSGTHDGSSI